MGGLPGCLEGCLDNGLEGLLGLPLEGLACLEGLSSWLEGWCWLGGRLAVESHMHGALGRSADNIQYLIYNMAYFIK